MEKKLIISILAVFAVLGALQPAYAVTDAAYLLKVESTSFLPETMYAGDVASLAVNVKNVGSSLSVIGLEGTLDIGDQFEQIELKDTIPVIAKNTSKTLVFRFRVKENTFPGYYPAFLTTTYLREGTNLSITETQSITIPVSKTEKNLDITLSPTVINPGTQTDVVFSIENVGGTPASNILFLWGEENNLILPVGSDNKRYISIIQPHEQVEILYSVAADPNIATGIYPLNLTTTFTDVNGTKTQTSQVGLIVGGKTDFEISAEVLNTGQVSVSIANIGSNDAGAVVVRIPNRAGVRVNGSSTAILGNLNKGDFTMANFQISSLGYAKEPVSKLKETTQPKSNETLQPRSKGTFEKSETSNVLTVEIDYTDTTGERQSVEKTVQLAFDTSELLSGSKLIGEAAYDKFRQKTNPFALAPWVLLVLLAGGAVAFNKFKAGNKALKELAKPVAVVGVLFLAVIYMFGSDLMATAVAAIISTALLLWFFKGKK